MKRILTITLNRISDNDPDISYLEQEGFEDRLEALKRGAFEYIGIHASADVQLEGETVQHLTSAGLWGIESDSGEGYLKSVEKEELDALKSELRAAGFSARAISKAIADARS